MSTAPTQPQWYTDPQTPGTPEWGTPEAHAAYGNTSENLPAGPPPMAPSQPGQEGATPPPPAPAQRRTGQLVAVASIAALLASGGTLAGARLLDGSPQTSSTVATSERAPATGPTTAAAAPIVDGTPTDWSTVAAAVAPSVVSITARTSSGGGQGSGVIIDRSGHVLTNNHVVAGAESLTVTLSDGRTYAASVKGTDPSTDLAVVTITGAPTDLTPISLGSSEGLKVGDPVMAVGNPLGLAGTVTTGIVSALDRPVKTQAADSGTGADGSGGATASEPVVTNAIQTSAAINPGNSGGALVNAAGQLVGINSAIASLGNSSGQSGNIGIGFAIPIDEAKVIADQLITKGVAIHAYLGVTPVDGSAKDGPATRAGAQIRTIQPGTPAAGAGLQVGDVVVAVDGARVESADSLVGFIREQSVGAKVTLTVLRDGQRKDLVATLTTRPTTTR